MQQYGDVEVGRPIEDRRKRRVVQRPAVDVGVDLHAAESELAHGAVEFGKGRLDVVHGQARGGGDEPVRVARDQLRHVVVGDARQCRGVGRAGQPLDGRIGDVDDLHVTGTGGVHCPETGVEVHERRHGALLILQPRLRRRNPHAGLAVAGRDDVVEGVDRHRRVGTGSRLQATGAEQSVSHSV